MSKITVGISDQKLCRSPDELVTYALGSCVGICLADIQAGIAGMAHIMLPDSGAVPGDGNRFKFADTAIKLLYDSMVAEGAQPSRITAKIAGGANMFGGSTSLMNIGGRNIEAVRDNLNKLGIPILAEDVGLNYGRTVFFDPQSGEMTVKSGLKGTKVL
ncbi:MAG: chemotaxis protein CheD [Eubacterium sp.]|nr:chemotaxis protein CheD [Eubacterium sp.]